MSSQAEEAAEQTADTVEAPISSSSTETDPTSGTIITVTVGATVPTGFEHTAAEEVKEKIGVDARVSKDRGRIYFPITTDKLFQVHLLRSVDNLFVVVAEYDHYQFKESKEETLNELQELASKLPWTNALEVWRLNRTLKKKKGHRKAGNATRAKSIAEPSEVPSAAEIEQHELPQVTSPDDDDAKAEVTPDSETRQQDLEDAAPEVKLIKFRVTCNRAGDKHSFSSNEAARDFGGAVQEFFQWKADMTKFDIEVLLNIHNDEVVIGIALTEESLHRRNISHFGPTTLRSTLCYGMLRSMFFNSVILEFSMHLEHLYHVAPHVTDDGIIESFYIAGDNNDMAVNRTVNNICHIQKRRADKGSPSALPIDTVQWDLSNLPIRTSSVDIIITDMPFGKRMGSRKKNWDLYPSCLREMARVCRPGSGKAVLLTQDKKCFAKAISRMGGLWRKLHTVWVNVGGLHAGVYLLKRTGAVFGQTSEDVHESRGRGDAQKDERDDKELC
uniref:THUMP domain containing 3 n=2 Tax=Poecilia TaxID=8080 RepID=A0A3B3UGA3_9TELE